MSATVRLPRRLRAMGASERLSVPLLLGMGLGLAIFYRASFQLPITALGLGLFAALALLRPDRGLPFVMLTAPLYLMPKGIWDERFGIRPEGVRFALHEVVLLVVLLATLAHIAWRLARPEGLRVALAALRDVVRANRATSVCAALFLIAGSVGVLLAVPEGRGEALRQWRWLVVEPLIFYGLARYWIERAPDPDAYRLLLAGSLALAGAGAAAVALLQYAGLDLVPLIGQRQSHTESVVVVDGVRRASSVYGHPNNLALFLGRAWPVALTLGLLYARGREAQVPAVFARVASGLLLCCTGLALAALLTSYSRGANLAALAAGGVLALGLLWRTEGTLPRWAMGAGLALLALVLIGMLRDGSGSIEARVLLWREALAMLRDHPLGIGPGQFYFYHNPEWGRGYIAPQLVGTSEQFAAHPHNLLLDLALSLGPLGLVAAAGLVASLFWNAWRGQRAPRPAARLLSLGLAAALAAALVHGLVDNFYFVPDLALFFWLALALVAPTRQASAPTPTD